MTTPATIHSLPPELLITILKLSFPSPSSPISASIYNKLSADQVLTSVHGDLMLVCKRWEQIMGKRRSHMAIGSAGLERLLSVLESSLLKPRDVKDLRLELTAAHECEDELKTSERDRRMDLMAEILDRCREVEHLSLLLGLAGHHKELCEAVTQLAKLKTLEECSNALPICFVNCMLGDLSHLDNLILRNLELLPHSLTPAAAIMLPTLQITITSITVDHLEVSEELGVLEHLLSSSQQTLTSLEIHTCRFGSIDSYEALNQLLFPFRRQLKTFSCLCGIKCGLQLTPDSLLLDSTLNNLPNINRLSLQARSFHSLSFISSCPDLHHLSLEWNHRWPVAQWRVAALAEALSLRGHSVSPLLVEIHGPLDTVDWIERKRMMEELFAAKDGFPKTDDGRVRDEIWLILPVWSEEARIVDGEFHRLRLFGGTESEYPRQREELLALCVPQTM